MIDPSRTTKILRQIHRTGIQVSIDDSIVRSAIELAHNLGIKVVAEGVEDKSTYDQLGAWGCDTVQGYYLSPALPADKFVRWLNESPWGLKRA